MNYEEFKSYVKENILKAFPGEYANHEVTVQETRKTNEILDGLCIRKDETCTPIIYLHSFYEAYEDGKSLEDIMSHIAEIYLSAKNNSDYPKDEVLNLFSSYENVKDRIFCKLINTERNKELLKTLPHINFNDLSVVFYILINRGKSDTATTLITNKLMNSFQVTVEDLEAAAKENMHKSDSFVVKEMREVLLELSGLTEEEFDRFHPASEDIQLLVLTSNSKLYGAVWMTNSKVLESISEKLGGNFFILPSSIHECLAIAKDLTEDDTATQVSNLRDMVHEVNCNEVSIEEQLSDNVYYYDSKKKKLEIA